MDDTWSEFITLPSGAKYYCLSCGTAYGQAISGGDYSGSYAKGYAFDDGVNSSYWGSSQTGTGISGAAYIGQDFGSGVTKHIRSIRLRTWSDTGNNLTSVKIQYSDNGSSWSDEGTHAISNTASSNVFIELAATAAHRYWRILANSNLSGGYIWAVPQVHMSERPAFGLDTGSWADSTWYYLYLIKNPNTGSVIHLWSASATSPTMPSGYTLKRRVSCLKTNAGQQFANTAYMQTDKCIHFSGYYWVLSNGGNSSLTAVSLSAYVPPNICVAVKFLNLGSYGSQTGAFQWSYISADGYYYNTAAIAIWGTYAVQQSANDAVVPLLRDRATPQVWYATINGGSQSIAVQGFILE